MDRVEDGIWGGDTWQHHTLRGPNKPAMIVAVSPFISVICILLFLLCPHVHVCVCVHVCVSVCVTGVCIDICEPPPSKISLVLPP